MNHPQHITLDTVFLPKIEVDQIATIVYDGTDTGRQQAIVGAVSRMAAEVPEQAQLAVTVRVMACACSRPDCGAAMLLCELGPVGQAPERFGMFRLLPATAEVPDHAPPATTH
ncbi:MAG TPA: hypothetical protein PKA20_17460 [Burkholderiaceae bacterium]|nr:hypothetical protein [Burkholderiaceae bacterium]